MEPAIVQALHIDHVFLRHQAPDWLGTVAFALCAITAHRVGYRRITLIAGGGMGLRPASDRLSLLGYEQGKRKFLS